MGSPRRRGVVRALRALSWPLLILLLAACASPTLPDPNLIQVQAQIPTLPLAEGAVEQTLVPARDGLVRLSGLWVVSGPPPAPSVPVTLTLRGPDGRILARQVLEGSRLTHNQGWSLSVPPQPDSVGEAFTLRIEGPTATHLALWASADDRWPEGDLTQGGRPRTGDLYLQGEARVSWSAWLGMAAEGLRRDGGLWPWGAAVLLLPGLALAGLDRRWRRRDLWERLAAAAALSLAFWGLSFLWLAYLPGRWGPWAVRLFLLLSLPPALRALARGRWGLPPARERLPFALAGLLLAGVLVLRVLQRTDLLVVPAWVDGLHHAALTDLLARDGQLPPTYEPYAPVPRPVYHFGLHAGGAALALAAGRPVPQALLVWGQLLNAAAVLALYPLGRRLGRHAWVGVAALVGAGFLSWMPAYLLTWGRYTQLAGQVLLPPLMVWTWEALRRDGRRSVPLLAFTAAGLFVTHHRVLAFYGMWLPWALLPGARRRGWGRRLGWTALAGGLSLLLVAPWVPDVVWNLWRPALAWRGGGEGLRAFPTSLLTSGRGWVLLRGAALGGALALLGRRGSLAALAPWGASLLILAHPEWLGLPPLALVNDVSVAIAAYVALAPLLGGLLLPLDPLSRRFPRPGRVALQGGLALLALGGALWGGAAQANVLNAVTLLALPQDVAGWRWVRENVPADARFLVNSFSWISGVYAGSDGGAWLPVVTGRGTTLPVSLYTLGPGGPERYWTVRRTQEAFQALAADPEALARELRRRGVAYVFAGRRGGWIRTDLLAASPEFELLYDRDGVRIFRVRPGP